jgi:hypothetical protein
MAAEHKGAAPTTGDAPATDTSAVPDPATQKV